MFRHLDAKRIQPRLNLAVVTSKTSQDFDQLFSRVHADVVMKNLPPDLEYADKVVIDKKGGGRRRRVRREPVRRPVLQAKVADRDGRIRRLLRRKGPRLDGTSGHERVRKIGKFLAPRRIGRLVEVEQELHVGLDTAEARRVTLRSAEQRSRRLREDPRLEQYVEDCSDSLCDVLRSRRPL